MTGKLSLAAATVAPFPFTCPKCGGWIGGDPRVDVRQHFERQHSISIGVARRKEMTLSATEFAYVRPVPGPTRRTWYIVAFDWPYDVVQFRPDEWLIAWAVADGPATEGVIT